MKLKTVDGYGFNRLAFFESLVNLKNYKMLIPIMHKHQKFIIAFTVLFMSLISAECAEQKNSVLEFKSETNEISDIVLPKDKSQAKITLQNSSSQEPYLWILAHGKDNRKIEHGACPLQIEVNGKLLEAELSVLQEPAYNYPVHPLSWRENKQKYDKEKQAWSFKYDVDFVMNNQCGKPGNWSVYVTKGYNHWYLFDLKSVAKQGVNEIVLTEQLVNGSGWNQWKSNYYDGINIGCVSLCSMNEAKAKIDQYNKQQIQINPEELSVEKAVKAKYDLEIPKAAPQSFTVTNGYITKQGKPFFMTYLNSFAELTGRETVLDIYAYYSLIDVSMAGPGNNAARGLLDLPIYLKDGWDKYQIKSWEIGMLLGNINIIYKRGILALPYVHDNQGGLPYLEENFPEAIACLRDGSAAKSPEAQSKYPNYANAKYKDFTQQFFTLLGRNFKKHPGISGYSVWEEPGWRLAQPKGKLVPQSANDLVLYHSWLNGEYKTIAQLNTEWGTQYKDFSDITFPVWKEQTANFVNFQQWRCNVVLDCTRIAYETMKKEDPNRFVLGQKTYGDIGATSSYWQHDLDNWMLTKYVDVSREYSNTSQLHLGRSSCKEFGKAMEADICLTDDAYRTWDKPAPWNKLLDQKALNIYPYLMNMLFNENKALHWEIYDMGYGADFHFIQYNKKWKKSPSKTWDGKAVRFEDAGSADVVIPEKTLRISRLHQWTIRNASLVLPAKIVTPQVAVLMSNSSRMIGYDPVNKLAKTSHLIQTWVDNAGQDFYCLGSLFDNLHLKFDCVDDRSIDNIFKYKVLIVGYQANVSNQNVADKIKEYVKKGGTVIFYPEAASMQDTDFRYTQESPGFGLSALCGASINNKKIIEKSGLKVADSAVIDGKYYGVDLNVKPEGVVLATDNDGKPVLVSDKDRHCYYFGGYLGLTYFQSYPKHEQLAKLIEDILLKAGVERPIDLKLADANVERRLILPGLMKGNGYWLLSVDNFSEKDQSVKLKINGLPKGNYEAVDISGERPVMLKSEDGNFHLKPNFEEAQPKYVSGKTDDITVNVPSYYSKVLLIRPAGEAVWVNSTEEALRSYTDMKKDLKIVVGQGCNQEEKKQAEELKKVLSGKGLKVSVVNDNEIKTKVIEGKLIEEKYELEKYRHEVLDTDTDLILIGNADENKAVKHLQTAGKYVYCKVPEMITADYPGKGRGIVQIAESINTISYDATDKGKDAVILAGSDNAGTIKALEKFISIIKK